MKKNVIKRSIWQGFFVVICTLATVFVSINVYAASADPKPQKFFQTDGTEITVYTYGDEYFHWTEDENGDVIVYNPQDKNWYYACIENNELIVGNDILGEEKDTYSADSRIKHDDIQYLIERSIESNVDHVRNNEMDLSSVCKSQRTVNALPKTNQELLLLLIEFNDVKLKDNKDNGQYWSSQYFSEGKSVAGYYKDMSNGLDIFIPAITQNIGLSSEITDTLYYQNDDVNINNIFGGNNGVSVTISNIYDGVIKVQFDMPHPIKYKMSGEDTKIEQALVTMALNMIKEKTEYDFSGFGENKQVAAIVAGGEASASYGPNGQVWAHCGVFEGSVIGLSGEYRYALHGEMQNPGRELSIGVPCHELGHVLGLPDLYNTETDPYGINARNDARNFYSLMGCGNWGAEYGQASGTTPVSLDAWSKIYLGYIKPIEYEVTDHAFVTIKSFGDIGDGENSQYNILRLNNINVDIDQYFLIENRQNVGWDKGMNRFLGGTSPFTGGIVIMQIDDEVVDNYIEENKVNIFNNHRGVDIVGHFGGTSNGDYFYANDKDMNELADNTMPSSKFYDPEYEISSTKRKSSHISIKVDSDSQSDMIVKLDKDEKITDKIPDNNFLQEIRKVIGKTNGEDIYKSDVANITKLNVERKNITNLAGIEYFTGLKEFVCAANRFTTLDMSKSPQLERLDCSYNLQMTSLNVSKNIELKELHCNYAKLTSLDITKNKKLIKVLCFYNQLTQLDVFNNKDLEYLDCSKNYVSVLDVSNNKKITYLNCVNNYLSSVDDVIGWQENGLILETTFKFTPQRNAS